MVSALAPVVFLLLGLAALSGAADVDEHDDDEAKEVQSLPRRVVQSQSATVVIALLARNKQHTLPHALAYIEALDYPKHRIALFVRTDHNEDATGEILDAWTAAVEDDYHDTNYSNREGAYDATDSPFSWNDERYDTVMAIKEEALEYASSLWADYVWFLDADVFITNNQTLRIFVDKGLEVSAPLLTSVGNYANFWGGMSSDYYYVRTDDYFPIFERKRKGCFEVPMVHSSVLINLRAKSSLHLTFLPSKMPHYDGPKDDIIAFALSARAASVPLHVCNEQRYGYVMAPMSDDYGLLEDDHANLVNLRLQMIADDAPILVRPGLEKYLPPRPEMKSRIGVDRVYLINLERRRDRRQKMEACTEELGIQYELVKAVDGKQLDDDYLQKTGIKMLSHFLEPYHKRPLKFGEIGCFMSHYNIWLDVIEKGYDKVLVLEDDIRFEPFFLTKMEELLLELTQDRPSWDLVYVGRKIMHDANEPWLEGSTRLVRVDYTYWTLAYLLRLSGAVKLVGAAPLSKMVPVDEYLPIMYDRHPNDTWKECFPDRTLEAFSVHPLLVHPTHYVGQEGYSSDTEATQQIRLEEHKPIKEEL